MQFSRTCHLRGFPFSFSFRCLSFLVNVSTRIYLPLSLSLSSFCFNSICYYDFISQRTWFSEHEARITFFNLSFPKHHSATVSFSLLRTFLSQWVLLLTLNTHKLTVVLVSGVEAVIVIHWRWHERLRRWIDVKKWTKVEKRCVGSQAPNDTLTNNKLNLLLLEDATSSLLLLLLVVTHLPLILCYVQTNFHFISSCCLLFIPLLCSHLILFLPFPRN